MRKILEEPPRKELQFLLPKKDMNSPKFKPRKQFRAMTDDPAMNQKEIKTSKIMEDPNRHNRTQIQNSPTIIINNNFNVSVNLYDGPKAPNGQANQEIIPPINFRTDQIQGFMTDRMKDSNIAQRYFGPYTAKVEKREYDHQIHPHMPFSLSSPTSANSNPDISLFHKNQANKTNQK